MANNGFAFGDPKPSPDNFDSFNPKDVFADSGIFVPAVPEPIPASWRTPPVMSLDEVLDKPAVQLIQNSGRIVFHSIGDSGGIKEPAHQFAVADAMTADLSGKDFSKGSPAFLFHLGDVVYYFVQEVYYFDQFYDPYRDYNAPILAIPGNHDGVMFPKEAAKYSLEPFFNNFCSEKPTHLSEAQGCARTTMTQPGVYFTLDAPFVKIIGLYSNTSESTGELHGPSGDTQQLNFLAAQLQVAVTQRNHGDQRALIIAVHHPPFTGSVNHFPSPGMLKDIDAACKQAGIMPDLKPPAPGVTGTDGVGNPLTLKAYSESIFGFLRVTVDSKSIFVESVGVDQQSGKTPLQDSFTVNLEQHTVSDGGAAKGGGGRGGGGGGRKPKPRPGGGRPGAGKRKKP